MEYICKQNNLVVIHGIVMADLDLIQTHAPQVHDNSMMYDCIPDKFISVELWPKSTNLKCWQCDAIPDSYPKFIPINPEKTINGEDTCGVKGNFCEWNCAIDYVMCRVYGDERNDTLKLISLFEYKFSGRYRIKIPPSPPKTLMKNYCGANGITRAEWIARLKKIDKEYSLFLNS